MTTPSRAAFVLDGFLEQLLSEPDLQALFDDLTAEMPDPPADDAATADERERLVAYARQHELPPAVTSELPLQLWWWKQTAHAYGRARDDVRWLDYPSRRAPKLELLVKAPVAPRFRPGDALDEMEKSLDDYRRALHSRSAIRQDPTARERVQESAWRRRGRLMCSHDVLDRSYRELAREMGWDDDDRWRDVKRDVDAARGELLAATGAALEP